MGVFPHCTLVSLANKNKCLNKYQKLEGEAKGLGNLITAVGRILG